MTGRGGGHQPPEEPFGISRVNARDGSTDWDRGIQGYPSAQNVTFNKKRESMALWARIMSC